MSGLDAHVSNKPYQMNFLTSLKRFPGLIAGWGTGKTMCAILKSYIHARAFKNNLGLIVRKTFTDLKDSTLKDFESYTGIHVPLHTKDVTLPNGSILMFRHGDELSGLQNINLGFAYLEQAEEFETDNTFQMLRGRLRRVLEPDMSIWDDPTFNIGPKFTPFIKALQEQRPQQAFVIANAKGHNWCWLYWVKKQAPSLQGDMYEEMAMETGISIEDLRSLSTPDQFDCYQANTFENREHLPDSFIADLMKLKVESPQKYEQYVLNSHEAFDIVGSFFARQISKALSAGRITDVPYDSAAKVFTFWDLGDIYTAIWFIQFQGPIIKVIRSYYDNKGQGIPYYAKMVSKLEYNYGGHYAGPDIDPDHGGNRKSMHTGKYTIEVAKECGIDFKIVQPHSVDNRIKASYDLIDLCWFDETLCEEGIDGLTHYKKKQNEKESTKDHIVYHKTPVDNWTKHLADAFGHLAIVYRYSNILGERVGETKQAIPKRFGHSAYRDRIKSLA